MHPEEGLTSLESSWGVLTIRGCKLVGLLLLNWALFFARMLLIRLRLVFFCNWWNPHNEVYCIGVGRGWFKKSFLYRTVQVAQKSGNFTESRCWRFCKKRAVQLLTRVIIFKTELQSQNLLVRIRFFKYHKKWILLQWGSRSWSCRVRQNDAIPSNSHTLIFEIPFGISEFW